MLGKFKGWFMALSSIGKVGLIAGASIIFIGAAGAASHPATVPKPPEPPPKVQGDKIEHKNVSMTEPIPFDTKTVNDPNLAAGTDKTQTEGLSGVKTKTYDVIYTNNKETNRTLIKQEVTTQPIAKVIAHGTYVVPATPVQPQAPSCPNGTYVNSAGNTVCSPYSSPSTPPGATAQCKDGTYSFSQIRSGTCSHHGGVAAWL